MTMRLRHVGSRHSRTGEQGREEQQQRIRRQENLNVVRSGTLRGYHPVYRRPPSLLQQQQQQYYKQAVSGGTTVIGPLSAAVPLRGRAGQGKAFNYNRAIAMSVADDNAVSRKKAPVSQAGRSVKDFDTEEDLRRALSCVSLGGEGTSTETIKRKEKHADWMLPVPDEEAQPQSVESEIQRLLTLKSYLILDAEKEEAIDRLTQEACRIFNVPMSLVSLVDLGRQFLLSNTGIAGDVRETPRSVAFCAHTILSKKGICIVNDTKKDDRFRDNQLVVGSPYLRFYAAVPLTSPEGYRLGTFCVEGPEPRPGGLTEEEQAKLHEYARKAMELIVRRRESLERSFARASDEIRRHAGVTTNLGGILYRHGECVIAMQSSQESIQTLMHVEQEGEATSSLPSKERREELEHLHTLLSSEQITLSGRLSLVKKVVAIFSESLPGQVVPSSIPHTSCSSCREESIPGLFNASSRLKGVLSRNHFVSLIFNEPFRIAMEANANGGEIDERQFIIPLEQCSKATLFNCGIIHYHWGSRDTAMQFFDLAASLSQANTPLDFDPVVLACLNNMSQIYLQHGRPNEAMEMLSDALTRGNAALAAMYQDDACSIASSSSTDGNDGEVDIRRTRRLRRKLARTVMNMGQVHFYNCDYQAAMAACDDALRLLHTNMEDMEVAAVWYNKSLLYHHNGDAKRALEYLDRFIDSARVLIGGEHVQLAEGLHKKGQFLFEMGNLYESMKPLNESLRIRRLKLGDRHCAVAESLCLIGKILQAREEYDFALNALKEGLAVQQSLLEGGTLSFELAQTLLDIGRAYHSKGNLNESLDVYLDVADMTRKYFGERHFFVARVDNILGNLYLEHGDVDKSVELFAEAMKINMEQGLEIDMNAVQDPLLRVQVDRSCAAACA